MDDRKLGWMLIVAGLVFIIVIFIFKIQIDRLTAQLMDLSGGVCVLESGECPHEQSNLPVYLGIVGITFILGLGIYLILFSKTTKTFETTQRDILRTIEKTKSKELKEERFKILLTGLDEDEKKVIMAVKEQDGISQSTLRYRTDLSKTKLSMVLKELEKKGLIAKVKKGKINNIFLKKAL